MTGFRGRRCESSAESAATPTAVFTERLNALEPQVQNLTGQVEEMNFKMRQGTDGLWRIVRWIDDPLAGDWGDGAAKPVGGITWSGVKQLR